MAKLWLFAGRMIASFPDSLQWACDPDRKSAEKWAAVLRWMPTYLFQGAHFGQIATAGPPLVGMTGKPAIQALITCRGPLFCG